jgi:hypothetical protein
MAQYAALASAGLFGQQYIRVQMTAYASPDGCGPGHLAARNSRAEKPPLATGCRGSIAAVVLEAGAPGQLRKFSRTKCLPQSRQEAQRQVFFANTDSIREHRRGIEGDNPNGYGGIGGYCVA